MGSSGLRGLSCALVTPRGADKFRPTEPLRTSRCPTPSCPRTRASRPPCAASPREEAEGALAAVGPTATSAPASTRCASRSRSSAASCASCVPSSPTPRPRTPCCATRAGACRSCATPPSSSRPWSGCAEGMDEARRARLLAPFRRPPRHHDARAEAELLPAFADDDGRRCATAAGGWTLRRDGWDALEPGLAATWERRARRHEGRPRRDPAPEPPARMAQARQGPLVSGAPPPADLARA